MAIWDRFKKSNEAPEKASVAKKVSEKKAPAKKAASASDKPKKATKKSESKKISSATKLATKTLIAPVVTEKSAYLSDRNVVTFKVARNANRIAVRQAFRELYKVTPLSVNIINVRGKRVRFGRLSGQRQDYKKALIALPKGTRVDVFEGV